MGRKILYSILGALIGILLSIIPLGVLKVENSIYSVSVIAIGAFLGGYIGYKLAKKIDLKEQIAIQAKPDTKLSAAYVSGSIVAVEFISTILGYVVAYFLMHTTYTTDEIFDLMAHPNILTLTILIVIIFISCWLGVRYVIAKNILKPDHDPKQVLQYIFIYNFAIYFSAKNIIGGFVGACISTGIIYIFLRQFKKEKSSNVTTV